MLSAAAVYAGDQSHVRNASPSKVRSNVKPCKVDWCWRVPGTQEALTRILTPKRSIDILREVRAAREAGRPYTIVFVAGPDSIPLSHLNLRSYIP